MHQAFLDYYTKQAQAADLPYSPGLVDNFPKSSVQPSFSTILKHKIQLSRLTQPVDPL